MNCQCVYTFENALQTTNIHRFNATCISTWWRLSLPFISTLSLSFSMFSYDSTTINWATCTDNLGKQHIWAFLRNVILKPIAVHDILISVRNMCSINLLWPSDVICRQCSVPSLVKVMNIMSPAWRQTSTRTNFVSIYVNWTLVINFNEIDQTWNKEVLVR